MGASRIQEETGGDHAFPFWQGKRRVVARRGGGDSGDMGAAHGFAGAWEEPGRKQQRNKGGMSLVCTWLDKESPRTSQQPLSSVSER